jgi:hypothetical protein
MQGDKPSSNDTRDCSNPKFGFGIEKRRFLGFAKSQTQPTETIEGKDLVGPKPKYIIYYDPSVKKGGKKRTKTSKKRAIKRRKNTRGKK